MPGRQIFVSLLVLPTIISPIVAGATWRLLFDNRYGPINQILGWFAGHPVTALWTVNPEPRLSRDHLLRDLAVDAVHVPDPAGGAVQRRSSLTEAAEIDGAGFWRSFRYIVLPAIWPVMAIAMLIRGLDLFRIFDIIWALTAGGPGTMTETISIYTYVQGFKQFETSYTAAIAFLVIAHSDRHRHLGDPAHGAGEMTRAALSPPQGRAGSPSAISSRSSLVVDLCLSDLLAVHHLVQDARRDLRFSAGLVSEEHPVQQLRGAVQGRRCRNRRQQPGPCHGLDLHRHDPRHHRRLLAWCASRPAAKISRCGSSRSA